MKTTQEMIDAVMGDMTQRQAAAMMGVSPQHFNEIYNGNKPVSLQFAAKAEATFGVDGWRMYCVGKKYAYKSFLREEKANAIEVEATEIGHMRAVWLMLLRGGGETEEGRKRTLAMLKSTSVCEGKDDAQG